MNPKILFTLIASFVFLFVFQQSVRAEKYPFRNYSVDDGLPYPVVTSIFQDRDGYMWFGTENGACRFDGITFTTYTTEDGLISNSVYSIIEDREGNLWFGTGGGVSRFDGENWISYTTGNGLANNSVSSILEDSEGNMWFGTWGGGVSRFDGENWTTYTTEDGQALFNRITTAFEDSRGNIWFGAWWGGARVFNGEKWIYSKDIKGLMHERYTVVCAFLEDSDGNIWLGGESIQKISGELDSGDYMVFTKVDMWPDYENTYKNRVREMLEDSKGNIWFGTIGSGVIMFDGENWKVYTTENGLPSNSIGLMLFGSMLEDKEGNLWFGTGNGVSRLSGTAFITYTTADGLADNSVNPKLEDSEGNLWFCSPRARGVSKFDGENWTTFTEENGLGGNNVPNMYKDNDGNLWFTCGSEGLSKFDGKKWTTYTAKDWVGIDSTYVSNIYLEDKEGNLWLNGSQGGGLVKFDGQNCTEYRIEDKSLLSGWIESIIEDKKGNFWISTGVGELSKIDGENWSNYSTKDGIILDQVRGMFEDKKGNLWFMTANGLTFYDGENWKTHTTEDGLVHNDLQVIHEDSSGYIWLGTRGGVSRFDGTKFTNYTTADGLSSNVCNFIIEHDSYLYFGTSKGLNRFDGETFKVYTASDGLAATTVLSPLKDSQGNLWFGSANGITKYDPNLDRHNPVPPPVYITHLRIFGKDTTVTSGLELGYQENNLRIDYVGISLTSPEDVVYNYKLEGLDEDWLVTNEHYISYPYLPPGDYTFKVKARNRDGVWSEKTAELSFEILPPFWSTAWFRGMILAVILLSIWGFHNAKTRNIKRRNIELESNVRERTAELDASNKRLKELDELKSNFLSTVSHELRTPLTSIRAFSEIMVDSQEEDGDPQQLRFLKIINEESERLSRLIDDLLDLSRIESGRQKWVMTHFNIKEAVDKSVTAVSSLVEGKKISLEVKISNELPSIHGDFDKLVQVVTNLLSNAVKFTPEEGRIDIKGGVITEDNKEFIEVSVADTGEGIAGDQLKKIFSRFYQVDSPEMKKRAGTGLGLSICREIMKHHEGKIWAESEPGKGSTFYFTLPVAEKK